MAASGVWMRSMGRVLSEESPVRVNVPSCAAIRPDNMRMVDPELPQSSGAPGWRNRPPVPVISRCEPLSSTVAPSALMQASERCGSAPVEKFESFVVPSANPASMA